MSISLPTHSLRRATVSLPHASSQYQQVRHATLLRRPRRPYTFTQLLTLSDGSTILHRTTSPVPVYRSQKDSRNNPMWNPTSKALRNAEDDESGRLRAFRERFGRGWDAGNNDDNGLDSATEDEDSLMDLITGFGRDTGGAAGRGEKEA